VVGLALGFARITEQSEIGGIDDCVDPLAGNILQHNGNPVLHAQENNLSTALA
jgi:hypothetical protein